MDPELESSAAHGEGQGALGDRSELANGDITSSEHRGASTGSAAGHAASSSAGEADNDDTAPLLPRRDPSEPSSSHAHAAGAPTRTHFTSFGKFVARQH
jgi:hypothetical protein